MTEDTNAFDVLHETAGDLTAIHDHVQLAPDAYSIVYDAINSTVGGVVITDLEGQITYVNPSFLRMFGYDRISEVLGNNVAELFAAEEVGSLLDVQIIIDAADGVTQQFAVGRGGGEPFVVEVASSSVRHSNGAVVGMMASFVDITRRKRAEQEKEDLIDKLRDALSKIKTLRGLIPICAACKKIRDDQGFWHQVEAYLSQHSEVELTHGICPDCSVRLYGDLGTKVRRSKTGSEP
jgi:PAS domain S-box-containing protein